MLVDFFEVKWQNIQLFALCWSYSELLYRVVYFSSNIPLDPGLLLDICSLYLNINLILSVHLLPFILFIILTNSTKIVFMRTHPILNNTKLIKRYETTSWDTERKSTIQFCFRHCFYILMKLNVMAREHSNINPM